MTAKNTDVTTTGGGQVAEYAPEHVREILRENLGADDTFTVSDLTRVTIPAQTAIFEIDSGSGEPEHASKLEGVIVEQQRHRRYYRGAYDPANTDPPNCYSPDGNVGWGVRFAEGEANGEGPHDCASCPLNQWGSATPREGQTESRGKACREGVDLYLLRRGGVLPMVLGIPPTSLRPLRRYMLGLANSETRFNEVETTVGVAKGDAASVATFQRGERLDDVTFQRVNVYRADIRALIAGTEAQRQAARTVS